MMNVLKACWRPVERYNRERALVADRRDILLCEKDLSQHAAGDFSVAVVQANMRLEDHSQVESGAYGTFVGIYDGHGGPDAARFTNERLFPIVKKLAYEQGGMSDSVLRQAVKDTENEFIGLVRRKWRLKPDLASVGSCVLVGAVSGPKLYVASLGDSRAVLGSVVRRRGLLQATQLSTEHNASRESIRNELIAEHPEDAHIVLMRHGVWRVKGIIQVSRSIGDLYLKRNEFNREPLLHKYRLPEPLKKPALSAEPVICSRVIRPEDRFVILASDGLWEHLNNQKAVNIVQRHPRFGIARRLIRAALKEAARKREMRYADIQGIDRGIRRHFHDDITVVVLFLDQDVMSKSVKIPPMSRQAWLDSTSVSGPNTPYDLFTTKDLRTER